MQRWIQPILALAIAVLWLGCAHETTTVTKTRTCSEPEYAQDGACGTIVEETVVTTEVDRCHGIVSCTFVVVGEVIALPFKIVGAAVDVVL